MPPKSDKRYDAAVKAVLDGHDLKRAWEECGKPGTNEDSALRNIRKRVAAEQAKTDSWVLISTLQAVEATQQQPLALMPPQDGDLAALD